MNNNLQKTTQSGYLLVAGYIREFCNIFKLSARINFPIQLIITMYYPPNYHIFGLDLNTDFNDNYNIRIQWKKMEIFSLLMDNINEIWCNYDRFIIKTTLNEIYFSQNYGMSSCSTSGFFQLPQNNHNKNISNDFVDIIGCGKFGHHILMVSRKGKFYGFGDNSNGQFGGDEKFDNDKNIVYKIPNLPEVFDGIRLKSIKCGADHTIFLTQNGRMYGCGENIYGQIGIINDNQHQRYQLKPILIPFLYNIIDVECGRKHNICLDKSGNIWVFGLNEHGQLGLDSNDINDIDKQYIDVAIVNKYFLSNNIKIKSIYCGYDFSCCIDINNLCYLFGSNETGQIGNGNEYQYRVNTPYLLFNKNIRFASLGVNHCILISVNNNIYTFGANNNHQCSTKRDCDQNIVKPYLLEKQEIGISRRRHIHKVIAGHSTSLIITSSVLVYDESIYDS